MSYVIIRYSNLTAENLDTLPQSLSLKFFNENYISHIKEQLKCFFIQSTLP